jgi:hypothetical protein
MFFKDQKEKKKGKEMAVGEYEQFCSSPPVKISSTK